VRPSFPATILAKMLTSLIMGLSNLFFIVHPVFFQSHYQPDGSYCVLSSQINNTQVHPIKNLKKNPLVSLSLFLLFPLWRQ
jgi:hypothetical protein